MAEVYTRNVVYTPDMTTRQALLAAVFAAPDDDLPRLVFADHLEENGEAERAYIISVGRGDQRTAKPRSHLPVDLNSSPAASVLEKLGGT